MFWTCNTSDLSTEPNQPLVAFRGFSQPPFVGHMKQVITKARHQIKPAPFSFPLCKRSTPPNEWKAPTDRPNQEVSFTGAGHVERTGTRQKQSILFSYWFRLMTVLRAPNMLFWQHSEGPCPFHFSFVFSSFFFGTQLTESFRFYNLQLVPQTSQKAMCWAVYEYQTYIASHE